jgi:hypothetical protein
MKQRFLNQKLGKRMSRKAALEKAKAFAPAPRGGKQAAWPGKSAPPRQAGR